MDIVVLVVRWDHLETVVELELDVRAGGLGRGAQQARVVRVAAEAAGDAENPRHSPGSPPGFTNCSSARTTVKIGVLIGLAPFALRKRLGILATASILLTSCCICKYLPN